MIDMLKKMAAGQSPFSSVDVSEAQRLIAEKKLFVLDVRTGAEFAAGHIAGAKHIPVDELAARLGEIASVKQVEFLVNCLSGGRSTRACEILHRAGFNGAINIDGGMSAWLSQGLPVEK